jgi:DNA-binding response OmpR family regulator
VEHDGRPRPLALVGAATPSSSAELEEDLRGLGYDVRPIELDGASDPADATVAVLVAQKELVACAQVAERIRRDGQGLPVVWVVDVAEVDQLQRYGGAFDDFLEAPYTRTELAARLRRVRRSAGGLGDEIIRTGDLELNLATYRASVAGRSLELTYMEYELLRFFAQTPGRIHTRDAILRNVWGYDYYGGIRTVDVHVRRVRAKLGQEHARLIDTVRGVGYGFTG